jgi:hypothetical protein
VVKALIARIKEVIPILEVLMGVGIMEVMVVVVITNHLMGISRGAWFCSGAGCGKRSE